jgi:hypothetical protein
MNVFYLDKDPELAAQYHCDKHVVKMIVESAQLLSTAHRLLDGELYYEKSKNNRNLKRWRLPDYREDIFYKAGFFNHPCGVWVRETSNNYGWLYSLFAFLCDEYTYRYNKVHLTCTKLRTDLAFQPVNITIGEMTEPALAMPDYCKLDDAVSSYRKYYKEEKSRLLSWKNRGEPFWINE